MNKLIIVDGENKYIINTAQDLYNLYNDWLMDFTEEQKAQEPSDYEVVSGIRDYYQFIFDNIEKDKYDLSKFEDTAFMML